MKKRNKGIWSLCLLCLALFGCMAWAPEKAQAAKSDFTIRNGVLTAYSGMGGHVTIPGGVKKIGKVDWPYDMTSVTIPGTVKEIGKEAFYLSSIKKVEIKKGVQKIGEGAFRSCIYLKSVTIPSSVQEIGKEAFCDSKLESIRIPDSVKSIGMRAFVGCDNLKTLTIGKRVSSIGDNAFSNCDSLTSVTIPGSIKVTGEWMFSGCKKLHTVVLSKGVTKIAYCSFRDCLKLKKVVIPNTVRQIGDFSFSECTSLQKIVIPKGVTGIGYGAFLDCKNLGSAMIPNGMKKIDEEVFSGCKKLKSVTIPESIKEIGRGAFDKTVKAKIKGCPVFKITNKDLYVNGATKLTCKSINTKSLSVTTGGKVTVKGKGSAAIKVLVNNSHVWTFHIVTEAPTPPQVVMIKAEWKGGKAIFKWKEQKQASGYQYLFAYDEDFTNPLKGNLGNKTSITLSSFRTKQKRIYIKIRAYIKDGKNTYYGKWSDAWYLSLKD